MKLHLNVNLSPRVLAVLGGVGTAALVAGGHALASALQSGALPVDPVVAGILAAVIGGAAAGLAQSNQVTPPPPAS